MCKPIWVIAILAALLLIGCSDDNPGGGSGPPAGNSCANVAGTWSMALEVEGGWFGGVFSRLVDLAQSDTCTVTGTIVGGAVGEGYTSNDSLYFRYGVAGSAPEDQVNCSLAIVDKYLMEGQYYSADGSGAMTFHGPDPDCSGTVEMQISSGLNPTFSWQPRCSVSFMLVEDMGGSDQWSVGNENANDLDSGITYGVTPPGIYSRDATPLVGDRTYAVALYRWLGTEDAYLLVGYVMIST